jgi:hypothetical protein
MFDHPAFAEGEIVGNGDVRQVVYGNDKGMHVEFRMEDVHQEYESEQQGRPIYKQEPFIRMYTPGDKTKVVDRAVRLKPQGDIPADPQRFPTQWNAFRAGAEQVAAGTPLAQWPQITSSQVRELNAVNIWTVEALAEVSDAALDGVGTAVAHCVMAPSCGWTPRRTIRSCPAWLRTISTCKSRSTHSPHSSHWRTAMNHGAAPAAPERKKSNDLQIKHDGLGHVRSAGWGARRRRERSVGRHGHHAG